MARTVYDIPTTLSDSEVWALISMFLLENGFSKIRFFGEELYELELKKSLLVRLLRPRPPQSFRIKTFLSNGMLHLEIYRYYSGWEFSPGDMLDTYGRELMQRLQPVLSLIASNKPGNSFLVETHLRAPVDPSTPDQRHTLPQEQTETAKRNKGLAIASMILGIVSIPVIPFIAPTIMIGIVGFVLGLISLVKKRDGKRIALLGIVLNILGMCLEVLFIMHLLSIR